MSRIGKQIIQVPANTQVTLAGEKVNVKGPLGEISRSMNSIIEITVENGEVKLTPKRETRESKALWGTYAAHLKNMVEGVNKPFEKKLILEGIGFKSEVKGEKIVLALGFSHPVVVEIPKGLKVTAEKNLITVSGINKEEVGAFASKLRSLKKPEPYKGKGMRYEKEVIRRKQGKKSA